MNDNRNFLVAMVLSLLVLLGWTYFVAQPGNRVEQAKQATLAKEEKLKALPQVAASHAPVALTDLSRTSALKLGGARVPIDTPTVDGSLRLKGALFDDLRLKSYHETVNPKSPEVVLLSPKQTSYPYYSVFGYVAAPGDTTKLPDDDTPWKLSGGSVLSPGHSLTLVWDNGQGLEFTRTISVDNEYMFTVADSVANKGTSAHTLYPYAYVARQGVAQSQHYWALHEGYVGVADGSLKDPSYDDFKKDGTPPQTFQSTGGWLGITDKYWMAAVVPPQDASFDGSFSASPYRDSRAYQADYRLAPHTVSPGQSYTLNQHLFAGAKVVSELQDYQKHLGIVNFDYAVDWGWFSFLTRPMFWVLDKSSDFFKSLNFFAPFGLAILFLTVLIRLALYPLANTGFKQMTRMKKLQPEMTRIKERFADDRVKQQQETMALYQREKLNPVSGCLPTLIQIPILFSLYKVFLVTIEMYHAPFYGWVHDLSAADPTSMVNLFGLIPFDPHVLLPSFLQFLNIGLWPFMLGITQWIQTKMNPAPADPTQAAMMTYMPFIFVFMFSTLPVGLVIYYTWSNALTLLQQYVMMRRHGVEIHLFNNLKLPWAKSPARTAGE